MNTLTAADVRTAICALLAALPDVELPAPSKVEVDGEGRTWVWFEETGMGYGIGSATKGGVRHPGGSHRSTAAVDAIIREAVRRIDINHYETQETK